jgi:hypothetical protein
MAFRDRFYTPTTARAILSWRLPLGAATAGAGWLVGVPLPLAVPLGAVVYLGAVAAAMPRAERRPVMDPFTLGEPWRRFMQGALRAERQLRRTVSNARSGPPRERLEGIVARIDHGIDEAWEVAKRGDEIDGAIRRLDPTALRSRLQTFQDQASEAPSPELHEAIMSLQRQLETADRLRVLSSQTALELRLGQTRFEELVARAEEVSIGMSDSDRYASDVDALVDELEALRLALEETRDP